MLKTDKLTGRCQIKVETDLKLALPKTNPVSNRDSQQD